MKTKNISTRLDWLHERLPRFACRWFLISLALLLLALLHFVAMAYTDAYGLHVMQQYAKAEAERSILSLPLGQHVANLAIFSTLSCVATVPVQLFLWLRARLCRGRTHA